MYNYFVNVAIRVMLNDHFILVLMSDKFRNGKYVNENGFIGHLGKSDNGSLINST